MTPNQHDPRVFLAAERTFLAWIRTGLSMMGFGFVVARFGLFLRELQATQHVATPQAPHLSLWFGVVLVLLGALVNLAAAIHHVRLVGQLRSGDLSFEKPSRFALTVALTLAAAGIAVAVYLLIMR